MKGLKILVAIVMVSSLVACNRNQNVYGKNDVDIDTISVLSVERMDEIHGTKDRTETEIYYFVATDKGAYRIDMAGLWAAPQLIGIVKPDRTYIVHTGWFDSPILKEYKRITGVIREL